MSRPFLWSQRAVQDLKSIKSSFDHRNRSNLYSTKLLKGFEASSVFIEKYPMASLPTSDEQVRGFVILHYIIFYQVYEEYILALSICDGRKNAAQFKNILK